MTSINRGVVVIKAKQPYVDWINSCDPSDRMSIDDVSNDCTAYLIPCWEDDAEYERILKKVFRAIFESELAGWIIEPSLWPKQRGYATFRKWFEIERHSVAFELGDGFIEVEGE